MRIPDYISPIVGWRVWQLDAQGLSSLNGEEWLPGRPLVAGCRASASGSLVGTARAARCSLDAPQFDCTCGIYGSKSLDYLRRTHFWQYANIHGEVFVWGSVVEHEQGLRAQFAYPKALYLSSEMLPVTLTETRARIQNLVEYGCDLFIAHNTSSIALWRKESGFNADGLEFLRSRAEEWYAQRRHERTLKVGDRIAVLGLGIGVVGHVDDAQVHAVLWNRSGLRIPRSEIVWNGNNRRWEASRGRWCRIPTCSFQPRHSK